VGGESREKERQCAGGERVPGRGKGEGLGLGFCGEEEEKERGVFPFLKKLLSINHILIIISC